MGEYWTRYLMDNGQRMSRRQAKKVERLEDEILNCIVLINRLEDLIEAYSEEIVRIKNGGEKQPRISSVNEINF